MAALLWLVFAFAIGWCATQPLVRPVQRALDTPSLFSQGRPVHPLIVLIPAALGLGLFLSAWLTYLAAYALSSWLSRPIGAANALFFLLGTAAVPRAVRWSRLAVPLRAPLRSDLIVLLAALSFCFFLAFDSFHGAAGELRIGKSISGDFGLHIATVRSFSFASNIPTEYVLFADAPNRYHFLFYFLCGNLEYLGMPLVWAINLPSVLGLWCALTMLWSFAAVFAGSRLAAGLTLIMFALRSSLSVWYYIADKGRSGSWYDVLRGLWETRRFFSSTPSEYWGIYSLNPFINQRHLGLSLALCYLLLFLLLPQLQHFSLPRLRRFAVRPSVRDAALWGALGIVLGGLMLLNSAVFLGTLCIVGVLLIFSPQPLLLVLLCGVGCLAAGLVNIVFLDAGAAASEVRLKMGYLAESAAVIDLTRYYLKAFGLLPVMLAVSFAVVPRQAKYLLIALCAPLVVANLFQFAPIIENNHKFFNLTVPILNVFAALLLARLMRGKTLRRISAVVLLFLLTATGVADFIVILRVNRMASVVVEDSPVIAALAVNTDPAATFLFPLYRWWHPVTLAGRKSFVGMPSIPGSIGYSVDERTQVAQAILECADRDSVERLPREYGISYLAFQQPCRFAEGLYEKVVLPPDADFVLYRVG